MRWGVLIIVCVAVLRPAALWADPVTVFAAASLAGPLDEVADAFERETGHEITRVYAGSSALARQVAAGAPADLVILANVAWMDHLAAERAIDATSRRVFLTNRLVLIGSWHRTEPLALADFPDTLGTDRVALALTDAVPAGIYARQALEALGFWSEIAAQVVEADNVRAAQRLVGMGAARYGIVYATDVAQERRVTILADIPPETHDLIQYPLALTNNASDTARAFLAFLDRPLARATFSGAGFGAPAP